MSEDWDIEAELQRLMASRERIRQLRAKVKYLNDQVPGTSHPDPHPEGLGVPGETDRKPRQPPDPFTSRR
jgi:hypothetical protein